MVARREGATVARWLVPFVAVADDCDVAPRLIEQSCPLPWPSLPSHNRHSTVFATYIPSRARCRGFTQAVSSFAHLGDTQIQTVLVFRHTARERYPPPPRIFRMRELAGNSL